MADIDIIAAEISTALSNQDSVAFVNAFGRANNPISLLIGLNRAAFTDTVAVAQQLLVRNRDQRNWLIRLKGIKVISPPTVKELNTSKTFPLDVEMSIALSNQDPIAFTDAYNQNDDPSSLASVLITAEFADRVALVQFLAERECLQYRLSDWFAAADVVTIQIGSHGIRCIARDGAHYEVSHGESPNVVMVQRWAKNSGVASRREVSYFQVVEDLLREKQVTGVPIGTWTDDLMLLAMVYAYPKDTDRID